MQKLLLTVDKVSNLFGKLFAWLIVLLTLTISWEVFSRYVLGWRIEAVEDGRLAADLVADIIATQGTAPGWLHADGGAAMTSKPLSSLLADLDVTRTHNRPRTSNDNPYSEAQFKTMKYAPVAMRLT